MSLFNIQEFNHKNKTISKIVTLALGLTISSVLFAYIAFFLNTNTFFNDYKNLYAIDRYLETNNIKENTNIINAPIPAALRESLPEIKSATVCSRTRDCSFTYQNQDYPSYMIMADSCFFETMGIEILEGDSKHLGMQNHIFLSDKLAKTIFKDENPVGNQILFYNTIPYTVAGLFKSVKNSTLNFEAVLSFVNVSNQFGYYAGWDGGDSFQGYVRLLPGIPYKKVSDKLQGALDPHLSIMEGYLEKFSLIPITDLATKRDDTPAFLFILNLLAIVVLLVSTFNYILSVLSSLPLRIKTIGIYKSCGASKFDIFKMFLAETEYIVIVSVCLTIILIYVMNDPIQTFTGLTLSNLFSWDNLWLPFLTLLTMALIAGIVPGIVLANTSTDYFFSAKTTGKQIWKKFLLFIQITGAAIILPLLTVSALQYYYLVNKPLGFESENIIYTWLGGRLESDEQLNMFMSEFKSIPYVEAAATSESPIISGLSGNPVWDDEENIKFISRLTSFDSSYIPTLKIDIVEGRNIKGEGEILINETFARKMQSKESLIGKTLLHYEKLGKIVGIAGDYSYNSLYSEIQPILIFGKAPIRNGVLIVRLSEITPERIKALNELLAKLLPNPPSFEVQTDTIRWQYEKTRQFRNVIGYTSIAIFIIVFIGLLGYIDNEISRKTKEIAIRKVNGATVSNILKIIWKDLALALIPGVVVGSMAAYPIVNRWMEQFAYKIDITWILYATTGLVIFVIISLCTILKSWRTANDNPVKHLKQE